MAKEFIEREAAIKRIRNLASNIGFENPAIAIDSCVSVLERMSCADVVEVKHGRWIDAPGGRTICKHCGEYPLYDYFGRQKFSAYCPNCGADMRGADNAAD